MLEEEAAAAAGKREGKKHKANEAARKRKRDTGESSKSPRKNDVTSIRIFELIFLSFLVFNFSFCFF